MIMRIDIPNRMDYKGACIALGIKDLVMPQLNGMYLTTVLRSWQVTGIHAMDEFAKDNGISACILADATGIGKTYEMIGLWLHVSITSLPLSDTVPFTYIIYSGIINALQRL